MCKIYLFSKIRQYFTASSFYGGCNEMFNSTFKENHCPVFSVRVAP